MSSRLVLLAVLVVAAVAAADSLRAPAERPRETAERRAPTVAIDRSVSEEFSVAPEATRILRNGEEYLSAAEIDTAFPAALEGAIFEIAHVAARPNGLVALGIYQFPAHGPVRSGIQIWRDRRLLGAFPVPPGTFAGGLGFTSDGRLVAAVDPGGRFARLYRSDGHLAGSISTTTW